jgi:bacillithiol biosynthesis cysteine-adding enzyme BshC
MRIHTVPYSRLGRRVPAFFAAWMEGGARAGGLLPAGPFDREAVRACAGERLAGTFSRREIADALAHGHRRLGSPEAVLQRIESLRANDTFCVIGGQQPGLAGGPLYVLYKALTVLALAREVESRFGFRCVPLFWNHSDDHDPAEVDGAGALDAEGRHRIVRAGLAGGGRPAWAVEDAAAMGRFRAAFAEALKGLPRGAEASALLEEEAAPGPAEAFTRLLTRVLGGRGLVVFEPRWVASAAAPFFARVLDAPAAAGGALAAGAEAFRKAGFLPPLDAGEDRPFDAPGAGLFLLHEGRRLRVDVRDGAFALNGGPVLSRDEMRRTLERSPERFTAGAALRPVLQDWLLPTLAAVAGPNEAVYLAQLWPLYEAFGVVRPPVVPRAGATLVDETAAATAEACGADWGAALRGEALAPPLPEALAAAFEAARRDVGAALDRLRAAVGDADGGADRNFAKTRERALESVDILARRTAEAAGRGEGARRVEALRTLVLPGGALQERALSWLWAIARFGPDLPEVLLEKLDFAARGHQVVCGAER